MGSSQLPGCAPALTLPSTPGWCCTVASCRPLAVAVPLSHRPAPSPSSGLHPHHPGRSLGRRHPAPVENSHPKGKAFSSPRGEPMSGEETTPSFTSAASSHSSFSMHSCKGCTSAHGAAVRHNLDSPHSTEPRDAGGHRDTSPAAPPPVTAGHMLHPTMGVCTPGLWSQGKQLWSLLEAGTSPGETAELPALITWGLS